MAPFEAASEEDRTLKTERLILAPATEDDAEEAFELVTHSELTFIARDRLPTTPDDMRSSIVRTRSGEMNSDELLHHEWMVRRQSDQVLIALASCNVMRKFDLAPVSREGEGEAESLEVRAVEPTVYVHPSHQGHGYGPEAVAAIEVFAHQRYGAIESLPKIDPSNERARDRAREAGAEQLLPAGIYDPMETWRRLLP